eukprot:372325-Rhodomonas_salina.1
MMYGPTSCYRISSTEIGYGATRQQSLRWSRPRQTRLVTCPISLRDSHMAEAGHVSNLPMRICYEGCGTETAYGGTSGAREGQGQRSCARAR